MAGEQGTTGDLSDLVVRCDCGKGRSLFEAAQLGSGALGPCSGARPWLGSRDTAEPCGEPSRLLIRTASNAYFPQVLSALSLPDAVGTIEKAVADVWHLLQVVDSAESLKVLKRLPQVAEKVGGFGDGELLAAIERLRSGDPRPRNLRGTELDSLLAAPEGYGDDATFDPISMPGGCRIPRGESRGRRSASNASFSCTACARCSPWSGSPGSKR